MAQSDPSPNVRLALASALQRLPLADRWEIAEALIQHGEDATDHNLPQMVWYGIEPLVAADPARALALAESSKIPLVSQNIARRASVLDGGVGHLVQALGKGDAISAGRIPRAELTSFAARQIANFNNPALTGKLTKSWGSIAAPGGDGAAEIAKIKTVLTPAFLRTANLPNGRALYNVTCGTCHTLFGQGKQLGPELTGSNRADLDYLLENIVNPNALIGKDYELHLLTLKDGRSLAGMLREETDTTVTVLSLTGSDTVAKKDITKRETPGFSMMPPGQLTAFTPEQQRDLIAYLASPSQVPLPSEPGAEKFVVANRIPGALEGEGLRATATGGKAGPQPMERYVRGNWNWSGGAQLWWTGGKPGDRLDLTVPVSVPGTYEIQIVLTKAPDYANLKFLLDGKPVGNAFDGFSPPGAGVVHSPVLTLSKIELTPGDHRLTLEITGANPEATKSYMAGIDYIYLKRVL